MYKKLVAAVALTLGTSVVYAQTLQSGWYGGIDIGRTRTDADIADRTDTALGFDLGYRVNRNFALEGAYADLGKFGYNVGGVDGNYRPKALSLSAVGTMPVWDGLSVYGKAGLAHTEVKLDGPLSASDSSNGLLIGAGVLYDVNRNVYARAGWDRYADVGSDVTGKGNIDLYSLGVGYRF
jgi:OmpA-OmpF porin, OOP family